MGSHSSQESFLAFLFPNFSLKKARSSELGGYLTVYAGLFTLLMVPGKGIFAGGERDY
jgi:hypothetical protein